MGRLTSRRSTLPRAAIGVAAATVVAAVLSVFIAGPVRTAAPLPVALAAALRQALWSAGHGSGALVVLWTRVGDQRLLETGGLAGEVTSGPGVEGAYVALVAGSFTVQSPPPTATATSPGPVRHQGYLEVVVPVVTALVSSSPDYSPPSGYLSSYLNAAPPLSRLGPVHSGRLPALQPTTPGTVPDVEWLNIAQALGVLGRAHLAVSVGRLAAGPLFGTVVAEVPPPGAVARPGEVVRLTVWGP
ncbi:MAG: PASTA domain-containing protein [Candidatus Dormibacteraeota bacterium]|nr:PASTA domain-containing protein [Candidatus Dormibacteraeota bacterium]